MAWLVKYWIDDNKTVTYEGRWFFEKCFSVSDVLDELNTALSGFDNVTRVEIKKEDA